MVDLTSKTNSHCVTYLRTPLKDFHVKQSGPNDELRRSGHAVKENELHFVKYS